MRDRDLRDYGLEDPGLLNRIAAAEKLRRYRDDNIYDSQRLKHLGNRYESLFLKRLYGSPGENRAGDPTKN